MSKTKTFEDKKIKIEHSSGQTIESSYFKWLSDALNVPPQGGFGVEEMRARLLLSEKISIATKENKAIELEIADVTKVKEIINGSDKQPKFPFAILDKQIVEFIDTINAL